MALSDLHMQIFPYDYTADRPAMDRGLARAAAEARVAAREAANALLFDVGDAFEGGPVDCTLATEPGMHPMLGALSAAGVAAATLGNHDFDHGLTAVERLIAASPYPIVLCNLVRRLGATPAEDEPLAPPFALIERPLLCADGARRALRVGVTGILPPETVDWAGEALAGAVAARGAVEAVAACVPRMRAAGADLIVVLAHAGIGGAPDAPEGTRAAREVAALPGVDAVLAGHAHRLFPQPGWRMPPEGVDPTTGLCHDTPVVMPGRWGQALGIVDLALARDGARWHVAAARSAVRPVRETRPDPPVAAAARRLHARALAEIRRPVGRSAGPLHTYFALLTDSAPVRLVHAAQLAAVRAARPDVAADEGHLPLLSAAAPLKAGGLNGPEAYTDVPAGPLLGRHLIDLQIHANPLHVVTVTGAELRQWLEGAARVFAPVAPGARDAPLLSPGCASYGFDAIGGATWRIDVTAPGPGEPDDDAGLADGRVRDLRVNGRPVRPDDRFRIVTHSYRLGSHPFFLALRSRAEPLGGLTCRAALEDFLAAGGGERPLPPPSWRFAPVAGATALFPTGPGARAHTLPAPPGVLDRVGSDAAGFDLYRLDLSRPKALAHDAAHDPDAGHRAHLAV